MARMLVAALCETNKRVRIVNGSRSTVVKRKSQKQKTSHSRPGYRDENGQTFLAPKYSEVQWKKEMQERGFSFGG